ncbi:hypothetical protein CPC08DRAFT_315133 [Agrocybe pediades]|nr:hypothetical protein CPC08DRAFT_315133 [Agrocybe pediades]
MEFCKFCALCLNCGTAAHVHAQDHSKRFASIRPPSLSGCHVNPTRLPPSLIPMSLPHWVALCLFAASVFGFMPATPSNETLYALAQAGGITSIDRSSNLTLRWSPGL